MERRTGNRKRVGTFGAGFPLDHTGRLMLNRFAYYYATPVFDMGLAIEVSQEETPNFQALDGRVTVLAPAPGHTCLLCREVINPVAARDEALKRSNPDEYGQGLLRSRSSVIKLLE